MAIKHAVLLAALAAALASCRSADSEQLATAIQNGCADCIDPESTVDQSYVSIGVMPARYPIDWGSPNRMYVTTIAAGLGFGGESSTNPHGIGHVLLKVRCGKTAPFYLSQTGANDEATQFKDLDAKRVSMIFTTYDKDGKLYTDPAAEDDWEKSRKRQEALGAPGTYESKPADVQDKALQQLITLQNDLNVKLVKVDLPELIRRIKLLPPVPRRHFVRATIRITDAQCKAIRDWRDAYKASGGSKRYAIHRAPWIMDANEKYDGGACGSVSFAGAFYITGLDHKKAAARVTELPQIGTGRLTESIARDGRKLDGWYLLQNKIYNVPGSVECAKAGNKCAASDRPWLHELYDKWNGPEDVAGLHGRAWPVFGAVGGGLGMIVNTKTVPLVAFEPEKFYQEILARWNQANYSSFDHAGWCKFGDKVPTIILDGRAGPDGRDRTPRPGIKGGFDNADSDLF